jgi:ribosomal protein L28
MVIESEIEDVRNYADDSNEVFDLHVTEETIRALDEKGYVKTGEPKVKGWTPHVE